MGSRDSGETKVDPHWAQDPPWSFNGPSHGPTIHQTWPFIYWLYFCILGNKNGIKGLWGHKGWPPLGLGPALVLQWSLPWPWNTPNMALYILAIFWILCNKNGIKGVWGDKGRPSLGPRSALVLDCTLPWPYNTSNMALYKLAIVLHSMQQKWDQGTLETQRSTIIGSSTRLCP